jgi:hypothetical protein
VARTDTTRKTAVAPVASTRTNAANAGVIENPHARNIRRAYASRMSSFDSAFMIAATPIVRNQNTDPRSANARNPMITPNKGPESFSGHGAPKTTTRMPIRTATTNPPHIDLSRLRPRRPTSGNDTEFTADGDE